MRKQAIPRQAVLAGCESTNSESSALHTTRDSDIHTPYIDQQPHTIIMADEEERVKAEKLAAARKRVSPYISPRQREENRIGIADNTPSVTGSTTPETEEKDR